MVLATKRSHTLILRLMVGLALLAWPRVGSAQGTWSVISLLADRQHLTRSRRRSVRARALACCQGDPER
jgi:hypothetical protein